MLSGGLASMAGWLLLARGSLPGGAGTPITGDRAGDLGRVLGSHRGFLGSELLG